jgi:aminobutyraldehyde dehydrogenase
VNVVCGRGNTVGAPLVAQPEVAMISLTGSVASGEKVLSAAVNGTKRTHLELGGKAPVIVFDDADLGAVVAGLRMAAFYNAGQDCTAACRVYAGAKIYDNLVADLARAAGSLKRCTRQRRHRAVRLITAWHWNEWPASSSAGGASIWKPWRAAVRSMDRVLLKPTVIAGRCKATRSCAERFGPVLSVTRLRHRQAISGPTTDYGRGFAVDHRRRGHARSQRLRAGCTWINTHFTWSTRCLRG